MYRVHITDGNDDYRTDVLTTLLHVPGFMRGYPNGAGRYVLEYERSEQAEAAAYRLWRHTGEQPAIQGYTPEIAPEVLLHHARKLHTSYCYQHEQYREGGDAHKALYYLAQQQAIEELLAIVGTDTN